MNSPAMHDDSPQRWARIAGVMYLANYLTAVAGVAAMSWIKGSGPFAERASRLLASETLYRGALTSMAISWVILIIQPYALYMTLRGVNKRIAQLATLLGVSEAVVGAVSVMFGFQIMQVYLSVKTGGPLQNDQLQMMARMVNAAYDSGFNIAMLFFGPASLLFFYLFYKSNFFPKSLAAIGILGSALMIPASAMVLIAPAHADGVRLAAWIPMGIAEVATAFWLAFRGIRPARPSNS
jgi:hypothetical protein